MGIHFAGVFVGVPRDEFRDRVQAKCSFKRNDRFWPYAFLASIGTNLGFVFQASSIGLSRFVYCPRLVLGTYRYWKYVLLSFSQWTSASGSQGMLDPGGVELQICGVVLF